MSEDIDISIISDYIQQLEQCNTVFDVARTVIRNFVGYFLPKNAVYLLAPNSSHPYFSLVERYGIKDDLPGEIAGNGTLINLTRHKNGLIQFVDVDPNACIEAEIEFIKNFDFFLAIETPTDYAGLLLINFRDGQKFSPFELEFARIISSLASKTIRSLRRPVEAHLDKTTRLYIKDFLWAMMDQQKALCRELRRNDNVSFELKKNQLKRHLHVVDENGSDSLDIGYTIMLLRINNLEAVNKAFDFDRGNQILKEFGLNLKLLFRKSDIPCRYEGSQILILLPFTKKSELEGFQEPLSQLIKDQNQKNGLSGDLELSLSMGKAHFPTDGDETFLLVKIAENNLKQI